MATFMDNIQKSGIAIPELSKAEKSRERDRLGDEAFDEVTNMLSKSGKSLVVRPTGFGKTNLFVRLAKKYSKEIRNKRVMYIYPIKVIKDEICKKPRYMKDGIIERNVDFVTYQELTLKYNKFGNKYWASVLENKYSLIILDEVHRAGSEGFTNVYNSIYDLIGPDKIHLVGGTATPHRMMDTEENNITNNIFEGNEISTLTLEDIILMGIMKPPLYGKSMYSTDDLTKLVEEKANRYNKNAGNGLDNSGIQMILSKGLKDVLGAEEFIINSLENAEYNLRNKTYFKFIVFFNDIADVQDRSPVVERWFNDAFNVVLKDRYNLRSAYKVRKALVTSSDPDGELRKMADEDIDTSYFNKTERINNLKKDIRTVDLIMTVNMVNMGLHINDITGVVMLRGTKSEIIYFQQIGRCLSVLNNNRPLILDFVQNYTEMYDHKFKDIIKGDPRDAIAGTNGYARTAGDRDLILEYSNIDGLDFFDKLSKEENPELIDKVIWLYNEKLAPLCVVSSETGLSLFTIKGILEKYNIELRQETSMIGYIHDYSDKIKSLRAIFPFIYSNLVKKKLAEYDKGIKSIFDLFSERAS